MPDFDVVARVTTTDGKQETIVDTIRDRADARAAEAAVIVTAPDRGYNVLRVDAFSCIETDPEP